MGAGGGLGLLRCAFLSGIDETGPQFLNLSPSTFNAAGVFTTNEGKTLRVALNINRKSHRLQKGVNGAAREKEQARALEALAGSLEKVAGTKVVVLLDAAGGKARLLRKGEGNWVALSADTPKDQSAQGLQRWLMGLYGYSAVVRESKGTGKVSLRVAPGTFGQSSSTSSEGRQGVVLEGAPGRPLEKGALSSKPLALMTCRGSELANTCDMLLDGKGGDGSGLMLAPGTPVWFPEAK